MVLIASALLTPCSFASEAVAEFSGYAERPVPKVAPHGQRSVFHPCSQCHEHWETNNTPRHLAPVHDVGLQHGEGRLWCLTCHDAQDRNTLHTLRGSKTDFNEAWRVCGQCHSARQKDWYFGAHGKRERDWQGEPVRYDCTHCHNPHQPPFQQRKAQPPPQVRAGLQPMKSRQRHDVALWERPLAEKVEQTHD